MLNKDFSLSFEMTKNIAEFLQMHPKFIRMALFKTGIAKHRPDGKLPVQFGVGEKKLSLFLYLPKQFLIQFVQFLLVMQAGRVIPKTHGV